MARMKARQRGGAPGRVRIIGGDLRGSVLAVPERDGLRPTPNRLRETLFNWLQPYLGGARCLDLFAGSGALGIEALSRGAGQVCQVERDAALAAALRANLERLRQGEKARVAEADALSLLTGAPCAAFDIVFVDPPFAQDLWSRTATLLENGGWLAPRASIYLEMPVDTRIALPPAWLPRRETTAGEVRGVLYSRRTDQLS